jgi:hypothetical protein
MIKNEETITVKNLIDNAVQYAETNISLIKLKAINKGSSVTSAFAAYIIIAAFVLMLIILLSIGVSLWVGKILGESYYGFFITSGFFVLLIMILYLLRNKWLKIPIANSLVQNLRK